MAIARDRAAIVPAPCLTRPDNVIGLDADEPLVDFDAVWNHSRVSPELDFSEAV
jgi:hypothetical protein